MRELVEVLNGASTVAMSALLNSLWLALAAALLAWAILRFTLPVGAAARHLVWWAVLGSVLALPAGEWLLERRSVTPVEQTADPLAAIPNNVGRPPWAAARPAGSRPFQELGRPGQGARRGPGNPPHTFNGGVLPVEFDAGYWPLGVLALWSGSLVLQLGRIVWGYRYLRGVKARSARAPQDLRLNFDVWMLACRVRRPVRLLVSAEVTSPIAVGFRQPAVILPATLLDELTGRDLDHVLLHELAHLARRDDWTNLLARLAAGALALHPVARWVLGRIDREREMACDDWVVTATGSPQPYAASLARLFELRLAHRRALLASGVAVCRSQLAERIEKLLHCGRELTPRTSILRIALSVAATAAFVAASAMAPRWVAFAQAAAPPAEPQREVTAAPAAAPQPAAAPKPARAPRARAAIASSAVADPPAPAPSGAKGSLLAALVAAGYRDLSVDEIIELKNQGVTADFLTDISQAGWGKLSTKQLVELRVHGVSPQFAQEMREAGLRDVTLRDVIDARIYGVRPEQVRDIHSLGFGPYTVKQAIEFSIHGVRPDLFRALKEAGYSQADPREIIEAQIHGVRSNHLREAKQYGPNLTLKQVIRLKQAGVI